MVLLVKSDGICGVMAAVIPVAAAAMRKLLRAVLSVVIPITDTAERSRCRVATVAAPGWVLKHFTDCV